MGAVIPLADKPSNQSSVHVTHLGQNRGTSDKALDGNTSGIWADGTCMHTSKLEKGVCETYLVRHCK